MKNNKQDKDLDEHVKHLINSSIKDTIGKKPQETTPVVNEKDIDGKFNPRISDDQLTVTANFIAPSGKGKSLKIFDILERLHDMSIIDAVIDTKKINGILQYVNEQRKNVENAEIAKGKAPVENMPEHIQVIFDPEDYITLVNEIIEENKNQQIDYKKFSRLCILNEGMKVAQKNKSISGKKGMTVKGVVIPCKTKRNKLVKIGSNLTMDKAGDISSSCEGEFVYKKNEISIKNILVLKEGVNFKTGNIHFPGSVVIHGEVKTDFKIHSDENLLVHNTLGAADVSCGGNLVVANGGIIGKGDHKIIVENIVKSVHMENVHIEASNNIFIEKSAYHSEIFTNGMLHMGSNSKLLDCKVSARKGLTVQDIGNDSGIKSKIICGVDFKVSDKIKLIKIYRKKLSDKLDAMLQMDPMAETWEINKEIEKCDKGTEQILSNAEYNTEARINVNGTAYRGTEIENCNLKYEVIEELSNGFFYYNKKEEIIKFQNH